MSSSRRLNVNEPVLSGKKVFLRFPTAQDCSEFTALNRASSKLHRNFVRPPKQRKQFTTFLRRCAQPDSVCFLSCRNEDNAVLGSVVLSKIVRGPLQSAYLGYYIGARYAHAGYMTEAIQLVLRYAFRELKLHRVEANIQPLNVASLALVKRLGFVREGYSRRYLKVCGRWRDHERWAIIVEDWKASKKDHRGLQN
jgi:ribosomal-protein-alanine N-acetyltransferase